eukprot:277466-Lingulodinium_polyedra.AAC.1
MWVPSRSPIVAAQQYLSTLLRGRNRRLLLLWRVAGCQSFEEWCCGKPRPLRLLRRAVLAASC